MQDVVVFIRHVQAFQALLIKGSGAIAFGSIGILVYEALEDRDEYYLEIELE
jgi:hypothetical protein